MSAEKPGKGGNKEQFDLVKFTAWAGELAPAARNEKIDELVNGGDLSAEEGEQLKKAMDGEQQGTSDPKQEVYAAFAKVKAAYEAPEAQRLDFGMFVTETVSPYVDAVMALNGVTEGSKDVARSIVEVKKMKTAYEVPAGQRLDFGMFTTEVLSPYVDAILGLAKSQDETDRKSSDHGHI